MEGRCPVCGQPLQLVWVHGHGQCSSCGQNVEPCCQGSGDEPEVRPAAARPATARILAAGGLLWRDAARRQIALVHRPRYDDWCLPKGKLGASEPFEDAARREVEEETGFVPEIVGYAGEAFYCIDDQPKSVLYWNMVPASHAAAGPIDDEEVSEVAWLSVADALARLDYPNERALVERNSRA